MAEFRRDPIIGQWVVVHTDDSLPPGKYTSEDHQRQYRSTCQFCPGREHLTPPEVDALRSVGSAPNSFGWKVRVVSNKFPALKIEGAIEKRMEGMFELTDGVGAHEVVIENPDHDRDMADYSFEEVRDVLKKYQSRVVDLTGDKRFKYIIIFKNYGQNAGASVEHAHSQIIALPMIPKYVLEEMEGSKKYFNEHGKCVFCDILEQEHRDQERIIAQNDDFIAVCPFVPRYAFESWILPKKHTSDFASASDEELYQLARTLKETLWRMKKCLNDPSYNFYLHIAPINQEKEKSFHWHIEIVPHLRDISGFEWGTGFYVVRTSPSAAARYFREVKA